MDGTEVIINENDAAIAVTMTRASEPSSVLSTCAMAGFLKTEHHVPASR
jgi:hypothetical protein